MLFAQMLILTSYFKIGLFAICFNEIPLKMLKNEIYFVLRALLVLEIFGHIEWMVWLER